MINTVAKEIIKLFKVNKFVETGIHQGETLGTVIGWFSEMYEDFNNIEKGRYAIYDVDLVREYFDKAVIKYGNYNKNVYIENDSSEKFLKRLIDNNTFGEDDICMFYLDSHWYDYWPLRDEIKEILRLEKSIILIDDFYTPGKPFGYDTYQEVRLDLNYIKPIIAGKTDYIYYSAISNRDNRGMALIFIGYKEEELTKMKGLPLIKECLLTGALSLLGKSGRILLMGIGKQGIRSAIPTQFFENYIDRCISGYEIVTFGYNDGVDIRINPDDDFSEVIRVLPNQWMPDMCILPNCEFNLLPKGIEHAPFPTAYMAYDWDYQIHTAKTFVESADYTIVFGDYADKALSALGANNVKIFYPHAVAKEFFTPSPRKIKERKYDICYTTFIDNVLHLDRSEWVIALCRLAEKYRVQIVPHTTFHNYLELLQDSKLAFSHQRLGEMSIRIYEACSQGTVTLETGVEVNKYFKPNEEYIPVTKETIEKQVKKYLDDDELLQQMSERSYKKAMEEYEPRKLFKGLINLLYKLIENDSATRRFNTLSESERLIRRGEIYYFSFCRGVKGGSLLNKYIDYLQKSIQEFKKSVETEQTPRGVINLAISEASFYFWHYEGDILKEKVKEVILALKGLIDENPSYALAYFHLGLVYLRAGHHKEALESFAQALNVFRDPNSVVDPWCLYPADIESDPKSTFVLGKPLNTALLSLCKGDKNEAVSTIRNIYTAAILYYLSVLYEKEGELFRCMDSLIESYNLYPHSGIVAMQAARRLTVLGFREDSLTMFKEAVRLLPLDIDLRIEYLKHLYLFQMDREAMNETKNILDITQTMAMFKNKMLSLKEIVEGFGRFNKIASGYSHDSCKESILNKWIEILYANLIKNKKDIRLIVRIIQIWHELGRVDKIFEILEDYISKYPKEAYEDSTLTPVFKELYNYLETISDLRVEIFNKRLKRLREAHDLSTKVTSLSHKIRPPQVSVIIPTYNRPEFLSKALESVFSQTYKDIEVIVVNDGGTDVESVTSSLHKKGKIIYIKCDEHRGPSAARNTGIKAARGNYIAYLDDDDIYYPDHLATLVSFLEKSEYRVAYTDAFRVHMEKDGDRYGARKKDIPYSYDFDPDLILVQNLFPTLTVMHEKSCLDEIGFFDESLDTHEDWDLWIRMSRKFPFAHLKKVTCEFTIRRDGTSTTSKMKRDFLRTAKVIQERYKDSLTKKPWLLKASEKMIEIMSAETVLDYKVCPISIQNRPQTISSLISVIIQVKDSGYCLKHLIQMIRSQKKVKDLEIILMTSTSTKTIDEISKENEARVISIPETQFNHGSFMRSAVQEAKGDYLIFLDQEAMPINGYWLYNMILPFLNYPELAALTCQIPCLSDEDLYSLWAKDQMSRSLDYEGDFFYILSSSDREMYQWDCTIKDTKRKISFFDGILSCFRRDDIEEIIHSSTAYETNLELGARLLQNGMGVGYLRSTCIYHRKGNTVSGVFWHYFNVTKYSEKVPLYFFITHKIEWSSMAASIMGAYDLVRLSISESLEKDYESLDIIRSFLNTLQNYMNCTPGEMEERLKNVRDYGDDEIGWLLREVIGDLRLSTEEKYRFKKNFVIPDFIRHLEKFAEFTYRLRHALKEREKDFQLCLLKIFSRVVGETLGIFYLEMKSMGMLTEELKRLDRIVIARGSVPFLTKLQHSNSLKLCEKLRYRKFKENKLKIAVIDFNYFLNREVIKALKSLGHEIVEVRGRKDESARDVLGRMMRAIARYKPDFLLTINHLGFDEDGIFTSFIDSIELPVAVWYVDSPRIIIRSFEKNVSPYVSIFLWDRFYIKEILEMGFESVEYLPLAADEEVFRSIQLTPSEIKRYSTDVGFVGNSWYQRTKEELEGVPEGLHHIVERLSQILDQSRIPFHEALKSLSEDERNATGSLDVHQRLDLEAATYWRATSLYRTSCLKSLQEFHPVIHGDMDWRRLIGDGYEYELKPPLNYYKELPFFYNACKINFNATSLQMLTAVNQRVFDVPACGAFLLTDDQDALGELFDIGKEVITYKNREEIPELLKFYLNNSGERRSVAERGRERILRGHTYIHRIKSLIACMKKRYS